MARGQSENSKVLPSEPKAPDVREVALRNFPTEVRTIRHEFVEYVDQLGKQSKEAAKALGDQKKRRTDTFNGDKIAMDIFDKLRAVTQDRRDVILTQVAYLLDKLDMVGQRDLFNNIGQAGGLVNEKDEGSVFDKTGNKAAPKASETEPVKKLTGAEPPKHVPTPGIPLDEALDKFKGAKDEAEAKRAKVAAPKPTADVKESATPKPATDPAKIPKPSASPSPKPATPAPKPTTRSAAAAAKPTAVRTNRAPTPDEKKAIKKTADKYIPDPSRSPDDDEDRAPGAYRHLN